MRIIHYVRDPRGIIAAKMKKHGHFTPYGILSNNNRKGVKYHSTILCHKMLEDLKAGQKLKKQYSKRVMLVKYEDLIGDPLPTMQKIHDFLNLPLEDKIKSWFMRTTQTTRDVFKWKSLSVKSNSTWEALTWQNELMPQTVSIVTQACQEVLKQLNYL